MYHSTRGRLQNATAAEAIVKGIAPDGGLYVPIAIPKIDEGFIRELERMTYQQRAKRILSLFLPEFTGQELLTCIDNAYDQAKFSHVDVAPLHLIDNGPAVLELWHGPTCAFKDMALQMLPQLLTHSLKKVDSNDTIAILVATSGDTGKAALEGFKNVSQTKILVFYPEDGVSQVQRLQMATQEGSNVSVVAVKGNFDDAQTGVKVIFSDADLSKQLAANHIRLSSANSINWGRLLPQIVYYFSAYADMVRAGRIEFGQQVNFSVPTGNFGNILAGFYAKHMGLPIGRLICASNQNNVLTEFITNGVYDRNRPFHKTISPSMDILVSSNLERLLFHLSNDDAEQTAAWQKELREQGRYAVSADVLSAVHATFWADWAADDVTSTFIRQVYDKNGYLLDPHTAVAWKAYEKYAEETGDVAPCIIVSTASPFKFSDSVLNALRQSGTARPQDGLELLEELASFTGLSVPSPLAELKDKPVLHTAVCCKQEMGRAVKERLVDYK